MAIETLKCEYEKKPHNWKREAIRGRKPHFCPKHKPEIPAVAEGKRSAKLSNGKVLLHCMIGNHDWEREAKRGRVPNSCPEHAPEKLVIVPAHRSANGKEELTCENGNHTWERVPARGRKPRLCPAHSASAPRTIPVAVVAGSESGEALTAPKKRGRPKLHNSPEEEAEAARLRSIVKVDSLEAGLKARGTHLSQQTPYGLYRKVEEKASRVKGRAPTITWELVGSHSPLMREAFLKEHEAEFLNNEYRYERENRVIENATGSDSSESLSLVTA